MFEIAITNNIKSDFVILPENKYGFSNELHDSISFSNQQISISGLRYKQEEDDFIETQEYIIAVVGKVFNRFEYSSDIGVVTAKEISYLYTLYKESFVTRLKGNFVIVIYNKKNDQLLVIKDSLGLKYLYYKTEKESFYISTNLNDFKKLSRKINYSAVIEKLLFTFPIGEESFLEDVFMLPEAGILRVVKGVLAKDIYAGINALFAHKLPLKKFNKQTFLDIFEKSVLQRANVSSQLNASLTGGFDGRTNIAILLHNKINFHSYSFGKKGGENTEVPLNVANKLSLDYAPVYLDENYEHSYARCAMDTLHFSDGISNFERANYIYAMQIIVKHAFYNITGLLGGEMFAPVRLKTDYINSTYYDIVYLGLDFSIDTLLSEKGLKKYINPEITKNKLVLQKVIRNINERRKLINSWKNEELGWLYYLKDFMTLGFRQFYGNQMHLERYYNENLTPFYDVDLIEYLFATKHAFSYKNAFKDSLVLRRNNRKLQTWVINHFSKELAAIPVDRGYPTIYLTDIRRLLIPFIFFKRRKKLKLAEPEFDSPGWSNIFYKEILYNDSKFSNDLTDSTIIKEELAKYKKTDYNKAFNHLLSIAIWLEQ